MDDFGNATISIDDVRSGYASDLLLEANVIIATDPTSNEEEVVFGIHDWEKVENGGIQDDLAILRVEVNAAANDIAVLLAIIHTIHSGGEYDPEEFLPADTDNLL